MYCPLDKRKPCPLRLKPTETYLGESAEGYYVIEGFFDNIGNMFKRMVKFTPKSFTPGNIFKAVRNTTLTTMTGGAYLVLPKSVKKTMENVANVAMPIAAVGVSAALVGPSIMTMIGPKLSMVGKMLGKNASSIGGSLFDALGKLTGPKQSEIAQQVTPEDIAYAETHNGQFPRHIQQLIDEGERQTYGYAAMNTANPNMIRQPATEALYAPASLYPGLQQARMEQMNPQQEDSSSSAATVGLAVGGTALLFLLLRK